MIEKTHHIISRCHWDTSFDDKGLVSQLQNDISQWTTHRLHLEANDVFEKLCPKNQVWKIDQLHLDLGVIYYDSLRPTLSREFSKQIKEKLIHLILNSDTSNTIEIDTFENAQLSVLEHYLIYGFTTWNHDFKYVTIQNILSYQLKHNSEKLKLTLNVIGKNETSRKRLAWQTSEQDLHSILALLEPYRHEQIISYLAILIAIHADLFKPKTVGYGYSKNLWFWTFNYLFSNRGRLFNSANFLKSMILQLAYHFDSDSITILESIKKSRALKKYQRKNFKAAFVRDVESLNETKTKLKNNSFYYDALEQDNWRIFTDALLNPVSKLVKFKENDFSALATKLNVKELEKFKKVIKTTNASPQAWNDILKELNCNTLEPDHWVVLRDVLLNPVSKLSKFKKNDFNELVTKLSARDSERFKQIIKTTDASPTIWNKLLRQLDRTAVNVIFASLSPSYHKQILETLRILNSVNASHNDTVTNQQLWRICIQFLLRNKETNPNHIDVLKYCLETLETKTKTSKHEIIESLIQLDEKKTSIDDINYYNELNQFIASEIYPTNKLYEERIFKLLKNLVLKLNDSYEHPISESWISSNEVLLKMVKRKPLRTFEVLKTYRSTKGFTKQQFVKILDVFSILIMIRSSEPEMYKTLIKFNALFEDVIAQHSELSNTQSRKVFDALVFDCFDCMLENSLSSHNHSEVLIDHVLKSYYEFDFKTFYDLFDEVFKHSDIDELKLSKQFFLSKQKQILKAREQYVPQLILKENSTEKDKLLLSKIMQSLCLHKDITYSKLFSDSCLDALCLDAEIFMTRSVGVILEKKAAQLIKGEHDKLEQKLKTAFIKILLDYESHLGDKQLIVDQFNTIVTHPINGAKKLKLETNNSHKNLRETIVVEGNKVKLESIFKSIQSAYKTASKALKTKIKKENFARDFKLVMLLSPNLIRVLVRNERLTKSRVKALSNAVAFEEFIAAICQSIYGDYRIILQSLSTIHQMVNKLSSSYLISSLEFEIWHLALECISNETLDRKKIDLLTATVIQNLALNYGIESNDLIKVIEDEDMMMTSILKESLAKQSPYFKILKTNYSDIRPSDEIISCYENYRIEELCHIIILQNKLPNWCFYSHHILPKQVLKEILEFYPHVILKVLKFKKFTAVQLIRLNQMIELPDLVMTISRLNPGRRQPLMQAKTFYEVLNSIHIKRSFPGEVQHTFFKILLDVWTTSNWKLIEPEQILNQVIWSLCNASQVDRKETINALKSVERQLSVGFQLALNLHSDALNVTLKPTKMQELALKSIQRKDKELPSKIKNGIKINNAGLVLINNYIPHLFKHLNLTENDEFISIDAQLDAVHYLQYVATGISQTEEPYLILNKILCGFHPSEPVLDGIRISESHGLLISEMIETIISHWPSIGSSSIEGFMGNWLIRDGVLFEEDDRWKLIIEKRAYDILINTSPFSFSIINHQWMNKPLYVEWPY